MTCSITDGRPAAVAGGEDADRHGTDRARRGRRAGPARRWRRCSRRGGHVDAGGQAGDEPPEQGRDREGEREADDRERGPDEGPRSRPRRTGAGVRDTPPPTRETSRRRTRDSPTLIADGEHDEDEGEDGGGRAVEARAVGGVDDPGEDVVAQDRHGPEVAQRVERDEQAPGGGGRAHLAQGDLAEGLPRGAAQAAGDLLDAGVGPAQRREHGQVDVGVAAEREHEHRADEPGDLRHRGDPGEGRDVARDGERERRERGEHAATREVGARREEGEPDPDDEAQRGDEHDEQEAAPMSSEGALAQTMSSTRDSPASAVRTTR